MSCRLKRMSIAVVTQLSHVSVNTTSVSRTAYWRGVQRLKGQLATNAKTTTRPHTERAMTKIELK